MAALPLPKYGLDKLHLFPYHQTREKYRIATGEEPPPFDPTRPPKFWFDPAARQVTKRALIYENILATNEHGKALTGPDGKPYFEQLMILRSEAATVNIPMKNAANEPGADQPEAPPPLRALDPEEELFFDFGGVVLVRNKTIVDDSVIGFTTQDRAIMKAIARKLNVPV
ncbi:MAG: hypothetical protein HY858_07545 [Candidatus Solibacter usitatus]|nr:hypothetical protein [Candidatus Solibacter usitatus]